MSRCGIGEFIICGNVGVAGKITIKEENAMKLLLILDAVRGIDSTGAAFIRGNGEVAVVKQVGNPYELAEDRRFNPAFLRLNRAIIGHNRWATQGAVNKRNAHPFEFETLVGAHNGSLTSKWRLEDAKDFTVDSENFFHHVDKKGLKDAMDNTAGAWSFVWWDKHAETLNFLRNKERPMYYTQSKDNATMFWASEGWMLDVALARHGIERFEIKSTNEDMHYSMHIDEKGVMTPIDPVYTPSTYVPYVAPYPQNQQHHPRHNKWGANNKLPNEPLKLVEDKRPPLNLIEEKKSNNNIERGYVNSKGNSYEIISADVDCHGAQFLHCFDPLSPYLNVRLYVKPEDKILNDVGKFIKADVKDIKLHPSEGTYYKLNRDSVKYATVEEAAAAEELIVDAVIKEQEDEADNVPFSPLYTNHRGVEISEDAFYANYGCCAYCDGHVDPQYKFKFTVSGEAVCHECVANPEISSFVNFA